MKKKSKSKGVPGYNIPGPNSKFNKKTQDKVILYIERGNFKEVACKHAGIDSSTLNGWLRRGKKVYENGASTPLELEYEKFYLRFIDAEAFTENAYVDIIKKSAEEGEYKAAQWFLERRYRDRWGNRVHLDAVMQTSNSAASDADKLLTGLLTASDFEDTWDSIGDTKEGGDIGDTE